MPELLGAPRVDVCRGAPGSSIDAFTQCSPLSALSITADGPSSSMNGYSCLVYALVAAILYIHPQHICSQKETSHEVG